VLAEIRRRFISEARPLDAETEAALRTDPRPGAKTILATVAQRRSANRAEGQRLRHLLRFERALWATGVVHIAGVDEAGMSPFAGPVAAAAVVFARGCGYPGINDSKKLDAATQNRLAIEIKESAVAWSVAFAEVAEIDSVNIYWAGLVAMRRAIDGLSVAPHHVLLDARRLKELPIPQQSIVKGDCKSFDHCRGFDPGQNCT
jgi:ribonuclease HII